MNIALVVLDTLRKDFFDDHFEWLPGKRFENAWSTSHWTVPAHTTLFTGKYSSEVGNHRSDLSVPEDTDMIQENLSEEGYTCRGYTANPLISPKFGFERGFDQLTGNLTYRMSRSETFDWMKYITNSNEERIKRNLRGIWKSIVGPYDTVSSLKAGFEIKFSDTLLPVGNEDMGGQEALAEIKSTDFGDNEFYFLNLMEAHFPHERPSEYEKSELFEVPDHPLFFVDEESEFDPEKARNAYDESVEYLSDLYRDIFSVLETEFDYVITIADHGELLGEYEIYGHRYGVYPELVHVPLVISGEKSSGSTETPVSILDVHATIAELAELSVDSRGQSLLGELESKSYLTNYYGIQIKREEKIEALTDAGYSNQEITELDNQRHGIAHPSGGYTYETTSGISHQGDVIPENAEACLRTAVESIKERTEREDTQVADTIESQLEQLGYID
jgi:arylsulfatase A-like enzyme